MDSWQPVILFASKLNDLLPPQDLEFTYQTDF